MREGKIFFLEASSWERQHTFISVSGHGFIGHIQVLIFNEQNC